MSDARHQAVRAYVAAHVGRDDFDDDDDLFATGLASSLFAVQVVMWVERTRGVPVAGEDLDIANFSSVNQISAYLGQPHR